MRLENARKRACGSRDGTPGVRGIVASEWQHWHGGAWSHGPAKNAVGPGSAVRRAVEQPDGADGASRRPPGWTGGDQAAATCSPFGEHRRRSSSGCWTDTQGGATGRWNRQPTATSAVPGSVQGRQDGLVLDCRRDVARDAVRAMLDRRPRRSWTTDQAPSPSDYCGRRPTNTRHHEDHDGSGVPAEEGRLGETAITAEGSTCCPTMR
jgi:hypothetical protein